MLFKKSISFWCLAIQKWTHTIFIFISIYEFGLLKLDIFVSNQVGYENLGKHMSKHLKLMQF